MALQTPTTKACPVMTIFRRRHTGAGFLRYMLPSTSMVDSVSCLRYAECSRAPDYITNGHGYPMQTASCTWPCVVPVGEDPAAHGHWCAFPDLYCAMPHHAGSFGTWDVLPSISMVDSVSCLRYAEFPVPPITSLTAMVSRCRLLAAHGPTSCPSVRTQPLTATGAPSHISTMPCHTMKP